VENNEAVPVLSRQEDDGCARACSFAAAEPAVLGLFLRAQRQPKEPVPLSRLQKTALKCAPPKTRQRDNSVLHSIVPSILLFSRAFSNGAVAVVLVGFSVVFAAVSF
jgi:hypothetical protein